MALSRDELFEFKKRRIESVPIPGSGEVLIRNLNEFEYMNAIAKAKSLVMSNGKPMDVESEASKWGRSALIQASVINEESGELEFSDHVETIKSISQMDARVIDLLSDAIDKHNSFATTEAEQEALEKKSETIPGSGTPTS